MDYRALIENRKSVRAFQNKKVPAAMLKELADYYEQKAKYLLTDVETELVMFDDGSKEALEGAAGYNQFLVGAPQYLVLLSEKTELAYVNGGFMMQDLLLKVADLGLDSCWLTFADGEAVKNAIGIESDLEVVALAAFGYGVKASKRLRLNILSMSNVDISAKRRYTEPKRSVYDMVFLNSWGNSHKLDEYIGFFDDMLWEAFYAASLSPSYLNRQAYGFVLHDGFVTLVSRPDVYTTKLDGELSLGAVLLQFTAVAEDWAGSCSWKFGAEAARLELPEGYAVVASCQL